MQSQPYLQASTLRYPVESGGPEWLIREISEEKNKLGEGEMNTKIIDPPTTYLDIYKKNS